MHAATNEAGLGHVDVIGASGRSSATQPCTFKPVILAAIARLMRFRLVEVNVRETGVTFRASDYGFKAVSSGNPLPVFPKKYTKHVRFVIECVSGEFYHARGVSSITSRFRLDRERENGAEIRMVAVQGGGPSMSHEANLARLSEIAASGWNEEIATIDGRTVDLRDNEYMIVRVIDGVPHGLPESAGVTLRQVVAEAASQPAGSGDVSVGYAGPTEEIDSRPILRPCSFASADLVIGGTEQRTLLVELLKAARRLTHKVQSTLQACISKGYHGKIHASYRVGIVKTEPAELDVVLVNGGIIVFSTIALLQGGSGAGWFWILILSLLVIVNAYFLMRDRWPILKRIVGWMYMAVLMFCTLVLLADVVVLLITGKEWIPIAGHPHYEPNDDGKEHPEIRPEIRPVIPRR